MNDNSRIINLNRKRAGVAYLNLEEYLNNVETEKSKTKMKSYCRKLPVLIKTNGLLTTLSFIKGKSKSEKEYLYVFNWLESWLNSIYDTKGNIIENLIDIENKKYNIYTREAIEISIWYKRHAEAMMIFDAD